MSTFFFEGCVFLFLDLLLLYSGIEGRDVFSRWTDNFITLMSVVFLFMGAHVCVS